MKLPIALLSVVPTAALFALAIRYEAALVRALSGLPSWTGLALPLILVLIAFRRRRRAGARS